MSSIITLSSSLPVVEPSGTVIISAKVVDASSGTAVSGAVVNWSFTPANASVTLTSTTTTTNDNGITTNSVTSSVSAGIVITATLDDSSGVSSSFNVGFSSETLSAPHVPQAKNGTLDEKAVVGTVQAMVLRHTDNPEVGDDYTFYWGVSYLDRLDDGTSATFPWIINVNKSFSESDVFSDGEYAVYYSLTDINGNISYSPVLEIKVTGGTYSNPVYQAPQFPDVVNNTINYNLVANDSGVNVIVPYPQDDLYAGDEVSLYMRVYNEDYSTEIVSSTIVATYTITQTDIDNGAIAFTISADAVTDDEETFDDVRGQFWYTVTGTGSVAVSGTSYTKALIIDTVPPQ